MIKFYQEKKTGYLSQKCRRAQEENVPVQWLNNLIGE